MDPGLQNPVCAELTALAQSQVTPSPRTQREDVAGDEEDTLQAYSPISVHPTDSQQFKLSED